MSSGPERARPPAAALDGVSVAAGRAMLLRDVTLRVGRGDRVAILGPNGAGKSTLLSLLNATQRPTSGRVEILGLEPWGLPARRRAALRATLSTVFQRLDHNPLVPVSVRAVVEMGLGGGDAPPRRIDPHGRVDMALERMGIAHLAHRAYRTLSGGEQQKTQLAMALARSPRLMLLDEPTTGLDFDWQERLVAMIDELGATPGLTTLLTTHLVHQVPPTFDRVVLVRGGGILFDGPAREALTPARLGELYGCRVEVEVRHGRTYCFAAGAPVS